MTVKIKESEAVNCAFCDSKQMRGVMDFGQVALAGGFLKLEQIANEQKFPLKLQFCQNCYALQIVDKVPEDLMFKNYFYFSSSIKTLCEHFGSYASEVVERFLDIEKAKVLEFGCNDGVLLRPLADLGINTVIGVDPAKNILSSIEDPRISLINNYFNEEVARNIVDKYGKLDMVIANNVYAHIPDIKGVTRAIKNVLHENGIFIFEVHYLGKIINEMHYDMIYHEHLYYYSLLSAMKHFENYEMMIFDIKPIPIHAGSMRFYVCKKGGKYSKSVSPSVKELEAQERKLGFDRYETFSHFSKSVESQRYELIKLLNRLKKKSQNIAGYGASGRANTIIQYCGISHEHLDFMIDDAPAKHGFYTPGSHFPIYPGTILSSDNAPDYVVVFAWSFFKEIIIRNETFLKKGGQFILPLPEIKIYPPIK